jgi:hypothetical protein
MCPACSKQLDDTLDKCERFMLKNNRATTEQLHQGTGIPIDLIETFLKEKKLRSTNYANLTYPCEKCGRGIREARICLHCASSFREAFQPQKAAAPVRVAGLGLHTGDRYGR